MAESSLRRTLTISQGNPVIPVTRPMALVLMGLAVASVITGVLNRKRINKILKENAEREEAAALET